MKKSELIALIREEYKKMVEAETADGKKKKKKGCGNLKSCKVDADCPHDGYSCEEGCCYIFCKKGESDKECKARKKKALEESVKINGKTLLEHRFQKLAGIKSIKPTPILKEQYGDFDCDWQAWPGINNWIGEFLAMPHFSSNNPNQPCNMICKKMKIWNDKYQTSPSDVQRNQVGCKLGMVFSIMNNHNCGCPGF